MTGKRQCAPAVRNLVSVSTPARRRANNDDASGAEFKNFTVPKLKPIPSDPRTASAGIDLPAGSENAGGGLFDTEGSMVVDSVNQLSLSKAHATSISHVQLSTTRYTRARDVIPRGSKTLPRAPARFPTDETAANLQNSRSCRDLANQQSRANVTTRSPSAGVCAGSGDLTSVVQVTKGKELFSQLRSSEAGWSDFACALAGSTPAQHYTASEQGTRSAENAQQAADHLTPAQRSMPALRKSESGSTHSRRSVLEATGSEGVLEELRNTGDGGASPEYCPSAHHMAMDSIASDSDSSGSQPLACQTAIVKRRGRRTSSATVQRYGDWYDGNDGELDAALRAYNACQVAAEVQHVIDSTTQLQGGVVSRRSECTPSSATATAVSSQPISAAARVAAMTAELNEKAAALLPEAEDDAASGKQRGRHRKERNDVAPTADLRDRLQESWQGKSYYDRLKQIAEEDELHEQAAAAAAARLAHAGAAVSTAAPVSTTASSSDAVVEGQRAIVEPRAPRGGAPLRPPTARRGREADAKVSKPDSAAATGSPKQISLSQELSSSNTPTASKPAGAAKRADACVPPEEGASKPEATPGAAAGDVGTAVDTSQAAEVVRISAGKTVAKNAQKGSASAVAVASLVSDRGGRLDVKLKDTLAALEAKEAALQEETRFRRAAERRTAEAETEMLRGTRQLQKAEHEVKGLESQLDSAHESQQALEFRVATAEAMVAALRSEAAASAAAAAALAKQLAAFANLPTV